MILELCVIQGRMSPNVLLFLAALHRRVANLDLHLCHPQNSILKSEVTERELPCPFSVRKESVHNSSLPLPVQQSLQIERALARFPPPNEPPRRAGL